MKRLVFIILAFVCLAPSIGAQVRITPNIEAEVYGARGDGSHDDTAALQTAINLAISTGRPLQLHAANYKVTGYLDIHSTCTVNPQQPVASPCGLTIRGMGMGQTKLIQTSAATDLLKGDTASMVNAHYDFEDFSVVGPDTWSPRTTTSGNGIRFTGTDIPFVFLKNIQIYNFLGSGS
jgi:hypothetical protein